jgi:hypothetical protein
MGVCEEYDSMGVREKGATAKSGQLTVNSRERTKRRTVGGRPFDYAQGKQSKVERAKIGRAERRDTACAEVRGRRNGDGLGGKGRACPSSSLWVKAKHRKW